jgi:hypothetical protein
MAVEHEAETAEGTMREEGAGAANPASPVQWRALPTLGEGLERIALAGGIGLLTGIVWGWGGRQPPASFVAALGWALTLGAPALLATAASVVLERGLRSAALAAVGPNLAAALLSLLAPLLAMAIFVTLLPETFTLGIPVLFALALGLGAGFAVGGLRLWHMGRDARWLFIALGVACLFGLTLTFIVPAALSPGENGALGFYGCLIYVLGLPGAGGGAILGGLLRMRVEAAAYGDPPEDDDAALEDAPPLRRAAPAQPALGAVASWDTFEPPAPETPDAPPPLESIMTADDLIAALNQQRQSLLDAIVGLSDHQLDRKGVVGEWSIKNALAHLTTQEEVLTRVTPERLRTGEYPEELRAINADADASNARDVAAREHLSPTEQLAALAQARADLSTMIRELGDEALARAQPWPQWSDTLASYFLANVGEHEREHVAAIQAGAQQLREGQGEPGDAE